jgi:nitronate monooxygenase
MREIYKSFLHDEEMFAAILSAAPKVVSFHFGVPGETWIRAFREAGIVLLGTATSVGEARLMARAGVHAVVAQGYEAGGHRGIFDPHGDDEQLGTLPLTRLLARDLEIPVIAAGGIMDGAGIAAVLRLGAAAAQLGTAFIATDESAADEGYRAALFSDAAHNTVMTRAISGRPARCLANRFILLGATVEHRSIPHYPVAYDAGKALHVAPRKQASMDMVHTGPGRARLLQERRQRASWLRPWWKRSERRMPEMKEAENCLARPCAIGAHSFRQSSATTVRFVPSYLSDRYGHLK